MVDFFSGVVERNPDLLLKVDGVEAARLGLTPADVARAVSSAQLGADAGVLRTGDRTIGIRVRAPDSTRFSTQPLATLTVAHRDGGLSTPLSSLATFREEESRTEYQRENQRLMLAMTASVEGSSLGDVIRGTKAVLAQNAPPSGVRVELGGQYESQQRAFRALLIVLLLASFCVVAVMVLQFESFIEPLVILLAASVAQAARTRLRPMLMTTLCTLFGLLPLALGVGAGAELQRPLALAAIGGLALSTPVTLFMVPTIVVAIRRRLMSRVRSVQPSLHPPAEFGPATGIEQ